MDKPEHDILASNQAIFDDGVSTALNNSNHMNTLDDCFWKVLQSTICMKEMEMQKYNHKFLDMLSGCQFWTEEYKRNIAA